MATRSTSPAPSDPPPPPPPNPADANAGGTAEGTAEGDKGAGTPPNSTAKGADVDDASGTSTAQGNGTESLGDQVHPATMLNEADGNRTFMKPVQDPGPVLIPGSVEVKNPDRSKGEHRYSDVNDAVKVNMRTSTGHSEGFGRHRDGIVNEATMPPDSFVSGAASDVYNKTQGKGLTDVAAENAAKPREVAPVRE